MGPENHTDCSLSDASGCLHANEILIFFAITAALMTPHSGNIRSVKKKEA
jgi:hypothetical protein